MVQWQPKTGRMEDVVENCFLAIPVGAVKLLKSFLTFGRENLNLVIDNMCIAFK